MFLWGVPNLGFALLLFGVKALLPGNPARKRFVVCSVDGFAEGGKPIFQARPSHRDDPDMMDTDRQDPPEEPR